MVATVNINPYLTSTALGSFQIQSGGGFQGTALDSPNARFNLAGGILATSETLPMWGGVGISETTAPAGASPPNPAGVLGGNITRATTLTAAAAGQLTGFSVFDQDYAMINSPQSQVPLVGSGGSVHFYRLGSGARIWVAMDPTLVDLEGNIITQNVSWDFNNQVLQPYEASGGTVSVTSVTWASTNGGQGVVVCAAPSLVGGVGDVVNISGATNTGTGGNGAVNGNFVVTAFTDNEHFTIGMPAAAGVIGTIAGTILLNYGVGALGSLGVKVLHVEVGNSMTVAFNPTTGFANWNRSGSTALLLI